MEQFGRAVDVKIRTMDEEVTVKSARLYTDGFDIDFDVDLRDSAESSGAEITLYNLSAEDRIIAADAVQVELFAGYENDNGSNLTSMFLGEPIVQKSILRGQDWETVFQLTANLTLTQATKFSKSYPSGTDMYTVFDDLAKALGVPLLMDELAPRGEILKRGFALHGTVRSCLYEAASQFKVSFLTQYNTLAIGALNTPTIGGQPTAKGRREATVINFDSGMLDWPTVIWQVERKEVLDAQGKQKLDADGTKMTKALSLKTIEARSLLKPELRVGSVVKIESPQSDVSGEAASGAITNDVIEGDTLSINGFYVCNSVRHRGTSRASGDFDTVINGTAYTV